jgi:hypothetical protein
VQTFLIIWRLRHLSREFSVYIIIVEAIFLILSVSIAFGVHTDPPNRYFAAPTPVWRQSLIALVCLLSYALFHSIGAGLARSSSGKGSAWNISGSGWPSSAPFFCIFRSSSCTSGKCKREIGGTRPRSTCMDFILRMGTKFKLM